MTLKANLNNFIDGWGESSLVQKEPKGGGDILFKIIRYKYRDKINKRKNTSVLDRLRISLIRLIKKRNLIRLKTYDEINSVIGGNF